MGSRPVDRSLYPSPPAPAGLDSREELLEALADREHERWSRWMRWMFDNWLPENIERWKVQMVTAYADLPEHSKESDRREAREILALLSQPPAAEGATGD